MRCVQQQIVNGAAVSSVVVSVMTAGNANAVTEVAQLAAGDNRLGIIAFLFLPVVRPSFWLCPASLPARSSSCPPVHLSLMCVECRWAGCFLTSVSQVRPRMHVA